MLRNISSLQDIPNIGPRVAADLIAIGIKKPAQLKGKDPYKLYEQVNKKFHTRMDPCLLDVFIAATKFMDGGLAKPW